MKFKLTPEEMVKRELWSRVYAAVSGRIEQFSVGEREKLAVCEADRAVKNYDKRFETGE